MTPDQEYQKLKSEVDSYIDKVYAALETNEEMLEICKGWRIMYSPLIINPTIMFIGINPGAGWEGIDLDHHNKTHLEYLDWNYKLAKDTKDVFSSINSLNLLEKSVKTNFFYMITRKEKPLYKVTNFLGRGNEELLGEKFFQNARNWTLKLIEIIKPKIIICEGVQSYGNVTDLFMPSVKLKDDCESIYLEDQKIHLLGYSRRFSSIKNKQRFSEVLAEVLK